MSNLLFNCSIGIILTLAGTSHFAWWFYWYWAPIVSRQAVSNAAPGMLADGFAIGVGFMMIVYTIDKYRQSRLS